MKYIKLLTIGALFCFGFMAAILPQQSSALSAAGQKACFNKWDGNNSPINGFPAGYLKSDCDKSKGGNCKKVTAVEGGKSNAAITCVDPTAPNESSNGAIPDTEDPALQYKACKSADDCNLVKRYVNPLINKLLAPMAILAVMIGLIWGSIEFSISSGDPQRTAVAKGRIQKALIGLLAFMLLYAFLNWLLPGGLVP